MTELWQWDRVGDGAAWDPIASEGGSMIAAPDAEATIAQQLGVDPSKLGDPMQPKIVTAGWLDGVLPNLPNMLSWLLIGAVVVGGGVIVMTAMSAVRTIGAFVPTPKNLGLT